MFTHIGRVGEIVLSYLRINYIVLSECLHAAMNWICIIQIFALGRGII